MRSYIENSALPGDTILDPFMGTGATGVAAREARCGFIGIELDRGYCECAAKRLSAPILTQNSNTTPARGITDNSTAPTSDAEIDALLA